MKKEKFQIKLDPLTAHAFSSWAREAGQSPEKFMSEFLTDFADANVYYRLTDAGRELVDL